MEWKEQKCGKKHLKVPWSEVKCNDVRWNEAGGNLNVVKPYGRIVKCSEVWLGEVQMGRNEVSTSVVNWTEVYVLATGCLSLLEDI